MLADQIAKILLDKGAVKINPVEPFEWTSGIKSPIYCDNRALVSFVGAREEILNGFLEKIKEAGVEFDVVAGVATGAIAWGALVADRLKKPFCYIRPEPREHGTGKQVEGFVDKGVKVLVIEDLFSTAGSSVKAIAAIRAEAEADVVGIIAISTYEFEKAKTRLEEAEVRWWTLTTFTAIVGQLEISEAEKAAILEFASDPSGWWGNQK
ncbi:orotate phosphoribosyltransferase [Candidatus Gracilibacteria bacterium]|nr:orotate phosphoribosyltransferase [Candidatus Gracilibacteria bacterium]MCF7856543.1 orotate phosphoribosyltransferase [Candidatus Gracilibacteria bacterium]MCF7896866.1 orotate phosphoribosyltransferase [Candidatus Gracilibacteria bacterium]